MIRTSLNHEWLFVADPVISVRNYAHGGEMQGTMVDLPHDAMIHAARDPKAASKNQSGFYPGGIYCYIHKFYVPEDWRDQHHVLEFEGVYRNAQVFINGISAGGCACGYTEFLVEMDDYLRYGEENEIKVLANNQAQPTGRWYTGGGLYRGVNLLSSSHTHISAQGVNVDPSILSTHIAQITLRMELINAVPCPTELVYTAEIFDADGSCVSSETLPMQMSGASRETLIRRLTLREPRLWTPEHPNMYLYRVRLVAGDRELDREEGQFGVRVLAMDAEQGLLLNGRPIKLRGACIHHDNGILGAATFAQAEERRCRHLKEAGFNCIRSSHNPVSRAMLDACDKFGMLVMDEYSDVWTLAKNAFDDASHFSMDWEKDIAALIRKDYNHPSVILYCLGNEIPEGGTAYGARLARLMDAYIKQRDPARLTVLSVNALLTCGPKLPEVLKDVLSQQHTELTYGQQDEGMDGVSQINNFASLIHGPLGDAMLRHPAVTQVLTPYKNVADITGLNYMPARYELEKELCPQRLVLGTEEYPADIARLWGEVEKYPHVIGDMTWTGYDYIGEAGIGIFYYDGTMNFMPHWPDRLAYIGDIDIIGRRRCISYYREIVYGLRKQPYIGVRRMEHNGQEPSRTAWMFKDVLSSWTWRGYEGQTAHVDVYSDAPMVELTLNGRSMGILPAGKENSFTASFEVPYAAGKLTAYALRDGIRAECYSLETADMKVDLHPSPEGETLKAGGDDLLFIPVALKDASGRDNPQAKAVVHVQVEGNATLQAFGSADPSCEGSYDDASWATYDGQVMAVLRSGKMAGNATVTFTAEGYEPVKLSIPVVSE